ncbi:RNA 2'-phosphotransferase [Asticcacaulis solisilvae]|uniref:RNA 2'-phosphotransferase n=1 Tax=Asticcacaulis solisilvae TaxID=1217274 RepID=UPI003FD7AFFD
MDDKTISKFLSLVLRHQPETIGLMLDEAGWTDLSELVEKTRAHGKAITEDDVRRIAANCEKQRFSFSPDGLRIRAAQGHSVTVELGLKAVTPPDILFHGTATRFADAIRTEGLKPQARQQVHLSGDEETALKVGQRHGKPIIFRVAAGRMQAEGFAFFQADNGVWLTDTVPPQFLETL